METIDPGVTGRRTPVARKKRKLGIRRMMDRYGVSDRTIDNWTRDGKLPKPIKIGRLNFWDEDELDEFDAKRAG